MTQEPSSALRVQKCGNQTVMITDVILQRPYTPTLPPGPAVGKYQTIFVVDDEYFSRSIINLMLKEAGWIVEEFESCEGFLGRYRPCPDACLVLDVHFAGMGGLELLEYIRGAAFPLPVVVVSGSSGITEAVQSMKSGAFDFIEKPILERKLVSSVRRALEQSHELAEHRDLRAKLLSSLTSRERQVMRLVLSGSPSKNIAADLSISQRTVENHRASIMRKTSSRSIPALARLAQSLSL